MSNACLKSTFCGVNALVALVALALAGGGVWYHLKLQQVTDLRNRDSYQTEWNFNWPQAMPLIFIAIGVLALLVSCCGFCGGAGVKPCLITYNVCASIVIVALVATGVIATLIASQETETFIKKTMENGFLQVVNHVPGAQKQLSELESSLRCCGADGPVNYSNSLIKYPASCCDDDNCFGVTSRKGCTKVISTYTKWAFYIGTGGCALIVVLGVFNICLAIALLRGINSKNIS